MQAIKTKYLPATNTKPSRIKAECEAGSISISYDYSYSTEALHRVAAFKLIKKLGWNVDDLCTGGLKDCYVHIPAFKNSEDTADLPEFLKSQA